MRRRVTSGLRLGIASGLVVLLACLGGCSRIMGDKPGGAPIPNYPDGPAGLEALFHDVLVAAKADDRPRVHDLFQSLKMTRPELDRLFGPRAADLAHAYDEMMATLIHRGAVELVGMVYEKKYDAIEVVAASPAAAGDGGALEAPRPDQVALMGALVDPPPLYSVRLKKGGDKLGTRYDFFFFLDGHWRTGNQLGKVIAKRQAELTAPPPPR